MIQAYYCRGNYFLTLHSTLIVRPALWKVPSQQTEPGATQNYVPFSTILSNRAGLFRGALEASRTVGSEEEFKLHILIYGHMAMKEDEHSRQTEKTEQHKQNPCSLGKHPETSAGRAVSFPLQCRGKKAGETPSFVNLPWGDGLRQGPLRDPGRALHSSARVLPSPHSRQKL